jgi:putative lumazine-binding protein
MRACLTGLLAACLASAAAHAQGATPADAERDVMAVVNALFNGMRQVDSAMVRPLFHPKARLISVDLRGEGRPARVEESVDGFIQSIGRPRSELYDERLSNVRALIDGSLASVWADYAFYRGTTFSHCGVDHFLLVKEAGRWQIIELSDTRRTTC